MLIDNDKDRGFDRIYNLVYVILAVCIQIDDKNDVLSNDTLLKTLLSIRINNYY